MTTMNRLIIIGNGFDISHGLKTKFNEFITSYFCNAVNEFFKSDSYSDILLDIRYNISFGYFNKVPINNGNVYSTIRDLQSAQDVDFKINSILLQNIYAKFSNLKWVDIEVEFFNVLIATKRINKNANQADAIRTVNKELEFLKDKLVEYLKEIQSSFDKDSIKKEIANCMREEIKKGEILTVDLNKDQLPDQLYFLNFNYTSTFEGYYESCRKHINSSFNYIHGDLYQKYGNPIFGFGDEFDKKYLEFEEEKNYRLFIKHIKSFEYLQTKNFYELTRFLESEMFQVHIYGHSCGISDRTMLNQIFEHDHCKSIKIFYHKISTDSNDFTEKTYEISRHFKNKTMLRKKLVPFELSKEMPQPLIQ